MFWIGLCFAAAAIGGAITATSVDTWYATLAKPWFNPPAWVFGPVWTVLYAMMAAAAWLVWRRGRGVARPALALFVVQLALNVGWSGLFFGLRSPGLALIEIVLLWLAIAATAAAFARHDKVAAWLMLPYLGWVTFAAALNAAIWHLS